MTEEDFRRIADAREHAATGSGRRIREAAGYTIAEVAALVGISVASLSRWEKGEQRPRTKAAIRWADALARMERRGRVATRS
jgi:transcriptional regulator with XRE-family HTH domain